jgi:hypothetical protein
VPVVLQRKFNNFIMMKIIIIQAIAVGCLSSQISWAQCASGANAGGVCVPPPDQSYSPLNPQQQPRAVWVDRWGAIAFSATTNDGGHTENQESRSIATKIAMGDCARNGAKDCKVVLTFYNQCAAAAWGKGELGYSGAETRELAEQYAIVRCGDSTCKIVYSACSLAQRIR